MHTKPFRSRVISYFFTQVLSFSICVCPSLIHLSFLSVAFCDVLFDILSLSFSSFQSCRFPFVYLLLDSVLSPFKATSHVRCKQKDKHKDKHMCTEMTQAHDTVVLVHTYFSCVYAYTCFVRVSQPLLLFSFHFIIYFSVSCIVLFCLVFLFSLLLFLLFPSFYF